jgi:malate dehydrogenase (oxaloacetate-decarboxylating)
MTSSDDDPGSTPPRRPSSGYALTATVHPSHAGDVAVMERLVAAITRLGAEVRRSDVVGEQRVFTIACSDEVQQHAVRAAIAGHSTADVHDTTFALHRGGKLGIAPRTTIRCGDDLAMAYTPGVGRVSQAIADDPGAVWQYTGRSNAVAVLSNGTAVLGLGDIGPEAALPVMEGKAVLFKQVAGIDAYPVCIAARTADDVVAAAKAIAPTFGGINLEDIAAPACFEIEARLHDELDIPVFHDDQHGTAIVTLAAVRNAARAVGKRFDELTVAVVGTGAAGVACAQLLHHVGVAEIVGVDRQGILHARRDGLPRHKRWFVDHGNTSGRDGDVHEAVKGADVLLGLSGPGVIEAGWLADMADDAIVLAMANPVPEVMPEDVPANVAVVATGRSDYPNQINNVLAFPGVFRGMLDVSATRCTVEMKLAAADALAALVGSPTPERIVPGALDPAVVVAVAQAVARTARNQGHVRVP